MMTAVIDTLVEVLSTPPEPVLPPRSVGVHTPSGASDVPAVVLSLAVESFRGTGIGRLLRAPDERRGERYNGTLTLEIWANSLPEADGISRKLQSKLRSNPSDLFHRGFIRLRPANLGPVENMLHDPPAGSSFPVWKQRLGYRFVFETEEERESGGGGPITRIDVDMNEHIAEPFSVGEKQK